MVPKFGFVGSAFRLFLSYVMGCVFLAGFLRQAEASFPELPNESEPVPGLVQPMRQGSAPISVMGTVVNDNYTGSEKNGREGDYFGADDFLSVSYLLDTRWAQTSMNVWAHTVTSRKFGYRYDLLQWLVGRGFRDRSLSIDASLGLTYRGDMGLEAWQNAFQDFRDFPEVDLPYLRSRWGVKLRLNAEEMRPGFFGWDGLTGRIGTDIAWRNLPIKSWSDFGYSYGYGYWQGESFAGWRQYWNEVAPYTDFVRNGLIYGTAVRIGTASGWSVTTGVLIFRARNLLADPSYAQKDFKTSPQIWTTVGFGSGPILQSALGFF